jgi:phosphate transport system substrate-binding protein
MLKKFTILAATTAIGLAASPALALTPNVYPAAAIKGNGASGIANVNSAALECFGGPNNNLGFGNGTTTNIVDHTYFPAKVTPANPNYDCGTQSVQPNVDGFYISTGSGNGKANWRNKNAVGGITTNPYGVWTNIHYAFSESPISAGDLATYTTAAFPTTKAAIQIPVNVLPVAISYKPVYGKVMTASGIKTLALNLKFARADGTGGLRMKKSTYCGILNGTITNWNDAALKTDNGNLSLMSPNDDVTRWNTTGVPIKLVGRSDNSGTTNVFTRAITAQCGGKFTAGGTDQLPAAAKGTAVYNKTTGALQSGTETVGLFGVADGNDGVAHAIEFAIPDPVNIGEYTLGGKMGYNGADWVLPSIANPTTLHSADLQIALTTKFAAPTAANASIAFKTVVPPQSDSKGKYAPANVANGMRNDPLAWVTPANATTGIANPTAGYPIAGSANMLLYTCYADPAVRNAMQGFILMNLGKVATDSTGAKIPVKIVTNTAKGTDGLPLGIFAKNGVAPLPSNWVNAIVETFLTNVTTGNNPGALNLWIQSKQPKKTADIAAAVSNPTCVAGQGA